jgi:hypothetical protein
MNISSGVNLLNTAQQRSENAAREIASQSIQKTDTGGVPYNPESLIKPVLDLKRAEIETASAAKILETDKKMIGSILDIKA